MNQSNITERIERAIGPDKHWVIAQLLLLVAVAIGTPLATRGGKRLPVWTRLLALPLLVAAAWIAARAKADLAESFTMSPTPVHDGEMVEHGIYRVVRHPMYLSVLLAISGYAAAWRSWFGVFGVLAGVVFVAAKTRHEERALLARYGSYDEYRQRVRWRFIPWVY